MPLMSETEHAPVLLRGRVEADMMRLQELLQTMGSTLHVCDTFNNQARDLIKARHPDHVVSADKLEQEISK